MSVSGTATFASTVTVSDGATNLGDGVFYVDPTTFEVGINTTNPGVAFEVNEQNATQDGFAVYDSLGNPDFYIDTDGKVGIGKIPTRGFDVSGMQIRQDDNYKHEWGGSSLYIQGDYNSTGDDIFKIFTDSSEAVSVTANDMAVTGSITAADYYSGDSTQGATTTISVRKGDDSGACTITVKDGLITGDDC